MVLSGLILLPLLAMPTLALLKKNFQIKLFYSLVAFVHFVFSLSLFTKHGYLFEGMILEENIGIYKDLGFNLDFSLSAATVLILLAIDFLYLIFGTLSIRSGGRKEAVLLSASHSLILFALMSTNLLLSVLALFIFLTSCTFSDIKTWRSRNHSAKLLSFGMIALLGVCLVLGILYESVYGQSDLSMKALFEMRTPFVRGSLFSTQFVLFALYYIGFAALSFASVLNISNLGMRLEVFKPLLGLSLCVYVSHMYSSNLFPEAAKFYLPSLQSQKAGLIIFMLLGAFIFLVRNSVKLFLERPKHV